MKKIFGFFWNILMKGIVFLVPIIVLIAIIDQAVVYLMEITSPIAELLPYKSFVGLDKDYWAGLLVLIGIAFLAGIIATAKHAIKIKDWIEDRILSFLPGYRYMKITGEQFLGYQEDKSYQPVLVNFEDHSQIGYLIEAIDETTVAVYLPYAPNPMYGDLFYMHKDRIKAVDLSYIKAQNFIRNLGVGSEKYFKGKIKISALEK